MMLLSVHSLTPSYHLALCHAYPIPPPYCQIIDEQAAACRGFIQHIRKAPI